MISLLRRRNFLLFLGSELLGAQASIIGLTLVAVAAFDQSFVTSSMLGAVQAVLMVLLAFPAGVWVDRTRRRPVLVTAALAHSVLLFSVLAAWSLDMLTMSHLWVAAVGIGVASAFVYVARPSFLPTLVHRDALIAANGTLTAFGSLAGLGAGRAVKWLLAIAAAPVALLIEAVGALVSAFLLHRIDAPEAAAAGRRGFMKELREGLGFLGNYPPLRVVTFATGLAYLSLTVVTVNQARFPYNSMGLSDATFGWLGTGGTAGAVAGALLAWPIARRIGRIRTFWLSLMATQPFLLFVPNDWPGAFQAVPVFVQSIGFSIFVVTQVSCIQAIVPGGLLGRTTAAMYVLVTLLSTAGLLVSTLLNIFLSTQVVLLIGIAGLIAAGAVVMRSLQPALSG
ncbi:MFS transporter [Streptosporangium sp. 'caverna']|uniref:MFS transporter n=1 Tax=Streptosporangium sp. 'caverna' TaxID=2202249 RepID=UPI000D7D2E76|nr:MFS transporter [Streptosporangium sp. 'caverna']AWS45347.1 hypothetical protein DKM19_32505 [Streptosporangium sp. 'caverna']